MLHLLPSNAFCLAPTLEPMSTMMTSSRRLLRGSTRVFTSKWSK
jgi:hypothetical protein